MKKQFSVLILIIFLLSPGKLTAKIIFVSENGNNSNGSNWQNSYTSIQPAIDAASGGDSIFVAEGIYQIPSAIQLKEDVHLLGGFSGMEEFSSQRTKTDLDGNGIIEAWEYINTSVLRAEQTDRVLTQSANFSKPSLVDGFRITQGKSENGGGAYLKAKAILQACVIHENQATESGGGVYLDGATIKDCFVSDNVYGSNGGGIYATSSAKVQGCKILKNKIFLVNSGDVKIGDILDGGIVFYVDRANRTAHIMSLSLSPDSDWLTAKDWCSNYAVGGKEWSFPTNNQLHQIYIVKNTLDDILTAINGAALLEDKAYWSSSEHGERADVVIFDTGYAGSLGKTSSAAARAIRMVSF